MGKRLTICLVNDTFLKGRGVDNVIHNLAKRLGKKHEVYVMAGETNIIPENFKFVKLPIGKLFTGGLKDFLYFKKMKELGDFIWDFDLKNNIDVYNVHHVGLATAFKDFPLNTIYTWHGSPPSNNPARKFIVNYFNKKLKGENTICISDYLSVKAYELGTKSEQVIDEGCDTKKFKPTWEDKNFMLYVGRLEKHKHVEKVIRVANELNFSLKIVGYGTQEDYLKMYAKKNKKIQFLGRVSNKKLIELYQQCSFFISASEWECFGLIFLEAGCCGKPSVLYRIKEMPNFIDNGKTGLIAKNYEEFKSYANLLIEFPPIRKRMGKQAYNKYKKYSWDKTANEYEKCLMESL